MKRLLVRVLINKFEKILKEGNTVCIDHPKNLREGKHPTLPNKGYAAPGIHFNLLPVLQDLVAAKAMRSLLPGGKKIPVLEQILDLPFIS